MPDQVNPIAAEFGESSGISVPPPNKVVQESNQSDAFKKTMEEKARKVNEKDRDEQRSQANEEHQIDVTKPLDLEAEQTAQDNRPGSILDIQKTSNKPAAPIQTPEKAPEKTSKTSSASQDSSDLPPGEDTLTQRLPNAPHPIEKEKIKVEGISKKDAPAPLTPTNKQEPAPVIPSEKKVVEQTTMEGSTGEKSFSDQRPANPIPNQFEEKPLEKKEGHFPVKEPYQTQISCDKKPALEGPPPRPLLKEETHLRIEATEKPSLENKTPQSSTPLEKPKIQESPLPTEGKPVLPETKEVNKIEESQLPPPMENPQQSPPSEMPTKDIASIVTPFEMPVPIDSQKKDIQVSREEKDRDETMSKISSPPESDLLQDEKKEDQEKEKQAQTSQKLLDSVFSPPIETPSASFKEAIGFDRLPAHVLDLLDRICHVVTVMQIQGKTETTLHLASNIHPDLAEVEITITRYETAGNSYNIELKGPPRAVNLFEKNIDRLKKTFDSRKEEFKFEINEIRISLNDQKQGNKGP